MSDKLQFIHTSNDKLSRTIKAISKKVSSAIEYCQKIQAANYQIRVQTTKDNQGSSCGSVTTQSTRHRPANINLRISKKNYFKGGVIWLTVLFLRKHFLTKNIYSQKTFIYKTFSNKTFFNKNTFFNKRHFLTKKSFFNK